MWQTTVFIVLYFITSYFATDASRLVKKEVMEKTPFISFLCGLCHITIFFMSSFYFGYIIGPILSLLYILSIVRNCSSWIIGDSIKTRLINKYRKYYYEDGRLKDGFAEMINEKFRSIFTKWLVACAVLCLIFLIFSLAAVPYKIASNTFYWNWEAGAIFVVIQAICISANEEFFKRG